MDYLTIKEAAQLQSCSERYMQKQCKNGVLSAVIREHPQNHKPCYMIPITAFPEQLQARYYRQKKQEAGVLPEQVREIQEQQKKPKKPIREKSIEDCTEKERQLIQTWTAILIEWQAERGKYQRKTEFDRLYVGKCQLDKRRCSIFIMPPEQRPKEKFEIKQDCTKKPSGQIPGRFSFIPTFYFLTEFSAYRTNTL